MIQIQNDPALNYYYCQVGCAVAVGCVLITVPVKAWDDDTMASKRLLTFALSFRHRNYKEVDCGLKNYELKEAGPRLQ